MKLSLDFCFNNRYTILVMMRKEENMIEIGTEMIGYWGANIAYDDGQVIANDDGKMVIDFGEFKHHTLEEDIKGNWYTGVPAGVGVYIAQ